MVWGEKEERSIEPRAGLVGDWLTGHTEYLVRWIIYWDTNVT